MAKSQEIIFSDFAQSDYQLNYDTKVPILFTSTPAIILVVVPEATPSMLALSGLGVAGVGSILARRRRMKSRHVRALG